MTTFLYSCRLKPVSISPERVCFKFKKLRPFYFIFFLASIHAMKAQVSTFNQYNASLGGINPAYIAHIDKDQAALICRNQWPGYRLGSFSGALTANKFFPRINSSFGIISEYSFNHQGSYKNRSEGLQYGYRVLFLGNYYLCGGLGITHQAMETDVNNYYYKFDPKTTYNDVPGQKIKSEIVNGSYGIILYNHEQPGYIGFSVKNHQLASLSADNNPRSLKISPSFSIHGMTFVPFSREANFYFFAEIERMGKMSFEIKDTSSITLQPSCFYYMIQANLYLHKTGILGAGYKYFGNNYGCFNFRAAVLPRVNAYMAIGYSFDAKPYIQYDTIHLLASHEFFIKYNFSSNYR